MSAKRGLRIRGLRQRWLVNAVLPIVLVVIAIVTVYTLGVRRTYYSACLLYTSSDSFFKFNLSRLQINAKAACSGSLPSLATSSAVCKKSSSGLSSGTLKKSSLCASRRSRAVSYTHLDVYKRQRYGRAGGCQIT